VKSDHNRNESHDLKDPEGAVCACTACPVFRRTSSAPLSNRSVVVRLRRRFLHGHWNG